MNIKTTSRAAALLAVGLLASACTGPGGGPMVVTNQGAGTVVGAVAGGLIGSRFGQGGGKVAAIIGGSVIGGALGNYIGANLDAQEQQRLYGAQQNALYSGRPQSWRGNNGGNYGTFQPGPAYNTSAGYCREYTQTIYIGGRPQQGVGEACRNPDGSWRIVR